MNQFTVLNAKKKNRQYQPRYNPNFQRTVESFGAMFKVQNKQSQFIQKPQEDKLLLAKNSDQKERWHHSFESFRKIN